MRRETYLFWALVLMFTVAFFAMVPHAAMASTGQGTEFQKLYTTLTSWVNGLPGIMAAIALMIGGLYMSFVGGRSPAYFFYSALGAAAIFLIPTIAKGLGGAVW